MMKGVPRWQRPGDHSVTARTTKPAMTVPSHWLRGHMGAGANPRAGSRRPDVIVARMGWRVAGALAVLSIAPCLGCSSGSTRPLGTGVSSAGGNSAPSTGSGSGGSSGSRGGSSAPNPGSGSGGSSGTGGGSSTPNTGSGSGGSSGTGGGMSASQGGSSPNGGSGTDASATAGSGAGGSGSGANDAAAPADGPSGVPVRGSQPMVIPAEAWSRDLTATGYKDGVPIGGFGAGSMTWRYDGVFYKDRLHTGVKTQTPDPDSSFYLYEKCGTGAAVWKKLVATAVTGAGQVTYRALFPKAWFDYSGLTGFDAKVKVAQWSPVIAGDYQRSSYPVAAYEWEFSNPSAAACDVAVMFLFRNDSGVSAQSVSTPTTAGIKLARAGTANAASENDAEITLAAAPPAGATSSIQSAAKAADLEAQFGQAGVLSNAVGAQGLGAIAVKVQVAPKGRVEFPMVLAWEIPITKPGGGNAWYREYTRYFGRTGLHSWDIASETLANYAAWGDAIDAWQGEILANPKYPAWLKTSMFNELYYYIVGGTMWEAGAASGQTDNPDEDMFSSLECFDYPGYGTSDVRFYGSWPLALYWPAIDKQEVEQFCDSVTTTRTDRPKPIGTTAHDFGTLNDVFATWNWYTYRDSTVWKDLNSKLALMVYRDWALTGKNDQKFLSYCWPAVKIAMAKVKGQDSDGDGLPNSNGIDQTYDNMALAGNTAYCGTLFLAATEAAQEMATAMGDPTQAATYQAWLDLGKSSLEKELWNGTYYRMDTNPVAAQANRIMSDQLAGEWYAKACGLPGIVPAAHATSAFQTVYANNFMKFDNGTHGVVNVVLADGSRDSSSPQALESWVGVSWGVVAGMIQEGLATQADAVGNSIYNTIWQNNQLWFRTPEAWQSGVTNLRAMYYMRTNAVWAVKRAYDVALP